jgi:hypothetical protein
MRTDAELIREWKEGEARQKELWAEILRRGLYMTVLGIDPNRRDSAWRNPPTAKGSDFSAGVSGAPGRSRVAAKQPPQFDSRELDELAALL